MLKMEMYRAFQNKKFYLAMFAGIIIASMAFFLDSFKLALQVMEIQKGSAQGLMYMDKITAGINLFSAWMGLRGSVYQSVYFYVLPLLCVLPFGTSYCSDIKTGYVNNIVIRGEKKSYYAAKFVAVFVSGGVIAAFPLLLNLLLCMGFFPASEVVAGTRMFGVFARGIFSDIFYHNPFLYVFLYIMFDFCFFGLLNCVTLFISCLDNNKFIVAVAPFILYFSMHTFCIWLLGVSAWSPERYTCFTYFTDSAKWMVATQMLFILCMTIPYMRRALKETL
jgi:hypothetical protein